MVRQRFVNQVRRHKIEHMSLPILQDTASPIFAYLHDLNAVQREAIEAIDGPVLVLAGAGTGKTRVLTTRVAHLIVHHHVPLQKILCVTFTNKAAHEMRERIESLVGIPVNGLWMGTFHALCVRILRVHAEIIGMSPDFTILDADDQIRLMKQLMSAEGVDEKNIAARGLVSVISRWKDRGLSPDAVRDRHGDVAAQLYPLYEARLRTLNALDFGDLILKCLEIFRASPEVLQRYQQQFHYILVDEYQDTNTAQYLWLRALSAGHKNICCVGDEDQSIYGWRGAEITNILRFENDFPGAKIIRLEQNYRSTLHILGAASGLIQKNQDRLGKKLWTEGEGGEKVRLKSMWDSLDEARGVGDDIEDFQRHGTPLSQMAILVRASYLTREFEDRLLTLGVPYRVVGGARFYERQEIRDAIAYLRLICRPDDGLAFERIVNVPRRGIGESSVKTLHMAARAQGWSVVEAARRLVETDEIKPATRKAIQNFLTQIELWRGRMHDMAPADFVKMVLEESGYVSMWQNDKSADSTGRLENLKELVSAIAEFETIASFLDHVSLVAENSSQASQESVSIMTLHSAKGLEFDVVFLCGWEEGVFPNPRAMEENGNSGLEEERRLAYVGLTRARKRAIITTCVNRRIQGRWQSNLPSRFLGELPPQHIENERPMRQQGSHSYGFTNHARREPSQIMSMVGQKVFHIKFGYGKVMKVEGEKLDVNFEHTGVKKVLASFVEKVK